VITKRLVSSTYEKSILWRLCDYQKFSLLETLRDVGGFKITVHWMKTQDDSGRDGKKTGYLSKPQNWRSFDLTIFDFIKRHMDKGERSLALYEKSAHANGIQFVNDHIENYQGRPELLDRIRNDKKSNMIFFDPDNGIEVKSTNSNTVHKYVLWSEVGTAFNSNKSVLIYQHFPRKKRGVFIEEMFKKMRGRLSTDVFAIKVKHSVYFLLAQKSHILKIRKSITAYQNMWGSLISVCDPRTSNLW